MTGHDGYDDISVAAEGGTSPEQLKAAIIKELGSKDFAVRTGKEQAEKQAQDLSDALGFIRTALLVFAGVALLVGSFLIFNTFTVTVAQRTREFALLRTLGASRRQVLTSVMAESFVIGLGASIIGIALGLLIAPALRALFGAFGLELGNTSIQLHTRTIIVGLARRRDRHARVRLRPGAPRHAHRARRGDARGGHARHRARAQAPDPRRRGGRARRPRDPAVRAVRRPRQRQRHRLAAGLRRRADDVRLRAARARRWCAR